MKIKRHRRQDVRAMAKYLESCGGTYAFLDRTRARPEISCKKGCAACCRQLPKASLAEAVNLLVELKPEQLSPLMARVERECLAVKRVASQGVGKKGLSSRWVALGRPCVFLTVDEACGVYPRRPITCATHMVSSPPVNCSVGPVTHVLLDPSFIAKISQDQLRSGLGAGLSRSHFMPFALLPWALHWAALWLQLSPKKWRQVVRSPDYQCWGFALQRELGEDGAVVIDLE